QCERLLGRNAEYRAQQYQPALLRSERAGDGKRRPANRMQQTFDDQRLAQPDGVPHEGKYDQDFGHADEPPGEMPDGADEEASARRIDRPEMLVDGVDGAEHAPFPVAGETAHGPT